jgi:hypothetical protein
MSDPETTLPPGEQPAARDYGLVGMGALALLVVAVVLRRLDLWALFPALVGAVALLFRWRAGPVFVLLAVLLLLGSWWVGTNPGQLLSFVLAWVTALWSGEHFPRWRAGPPSRGVLPLPDFLLAVSLLTYAAAQYRLQGLTRRLFPPDPQRRRAAVLAGPESARKHDEAARREPGLVTAREMWMLLPAVAVCAGAATLFWAWLRGRDTDLEFIESTWQGILVLWLLGGGLLIVAGVMRYLALRRMTRPEAEMFLQDVLWRETRGEQRRLNRWLAWAWLKRRRREEREQS